VGPEGRVGTCINC